MSVQNIKTALDLGIITIPQASDLLKQEIEKNDRQQPQPKTNPRLRHR